MAQISCKCGQVLVTYIEKTGLYKVTYTNKGRKGGELYCRLPVTTACGACFKQFTFDSKSEADFSCPCRNGRGVPIIRSYRAERREGDWVIVNASRIQKSVDCADALVECQNDNCNVRVFVVDYHQTGKVLPTHDDVYFARHKHQQDGSIHILKKNTTQEEIDIMV